MCRLLALGPKLKPLPKPPKSIMSRSSPPQRSPNARRGTDLPSSSLSVKKETKSVVGQPYSSPNSAGNPLYDIGYTRIDLEAEADRIKLINSLLDQDSKPEPTQKDITEDPPIESSMKTSAKGTSKKAAKNVCWQDPTYLVQKMLRFYALKSYDKLWNHARFTAVSCLKHGVSKNKLVSMLQ